MARLFGCFKNLIMKSLRARFSGLGSLLRGTATIFDISGTGVYRPPAPGSPEGDLEALRQDFAAISNDFRKVLNVELKTLKGPRASQP